MRKGFNLMNGGYEKALANLRRYGIRLYVTFILGYDEDNADTTDETLAFAKRHNFYIVAFNHLTPFPGTPLYQRLKAEGRLLYDRWWLHPDYRYGMVPFAPRGMTAEEVEQRCIDARQPLLQPAVHFPAQPGLRGQRPRMVHVEPLLLDQPAVSLRSHAETKFSPG